MVCFHSQNMWKPVKSAPDSMWFRSMAPQEAVVTESLYVFFLFLKKWLYWEKHPADTCYKWSQWQNPYVKSLLKTSDALMGHISILHHSAVSAQSCSSAPSQCIFPPTDSVWVSISCLVSQPPFFICYSYKTLLSKTNCHWRLSFSIWAV